MVLSDFKLCLSYIANQPHVLPRLPGTLMALMVAVKRVQLLRKAHRTAHESDYKSPVYDSKTAQCISSTEVKVSQGLLRWPSGKEPTCIQETPETSPGLGRSPGGGNGNSLPYSCLEKSHEQRNLEGYSPWVTKESDIT